MNRIDYITTAIVYPNSRIHVGWAWELLGADWLVRGLKAFGRDVFFATGMDEHAAKVQKQAEAQGLSPKAYCDQMASDIEKVLSMMGISYDRFIRTSDADHERVVQALVQRAFDRGDIYKARYEGHFCEGCEAFYTDKDLVNGLCPAHQKPTQWIAEENYFFRLSKYQDRLLKLFEERPGFLQPEYRRAEVVNFIQAGLKDFSVSRSNFTWGVPLPFDPRHIVYVWFDALINYLTAAGLEFKLKDPSSPEAKLFDARWPARLHIIGKDISRFHCVYWPAMLMALDLPLPDQVFAHGYLNLKGERMSKSSGNVVTPDEVIGITGADPFRYYLLAENQFSQDANFGLDLLMLKANADLANDWGNLCNRTISMARKYFAGESFDAGTVMKSPLLDSTREVLASFEAFRIELRSKLDAVDPSGYILACNARSRLLNLYIDRTKPWSLAKAAAAGDAGAGSQLREVLATLLEGIRWTGTALLPVLPFGMPGLFGQLGLPVPALQGAIEKLCWGELKIAPQEPKPLYPRLELPVS
jgi:methionyl-tRNA synthetase